MTIEEKILWIDSQYKYSGTTSNFLYDIGNSLQSDFNKLSVELIECVVNKNLGNVSNVLGYENYPTPFNSQCIKIFLNLGVGSNIIYKFGQNLLMGIIDNHLVESTFINDDSDVVHSINVSDNTSEKIINNNVRYQISSIPNGYINVLIYSGSNVNLVDVAGNPPSSVCLCLKFTYEI